MQEFYGINLIPEVSGLRGSLDVALLQTSFHGIINLLFTGIELKIIEAD